MHHFNFKDNQMYAENVAITDIAADIGTPFYCYSSATLRRHVNVLESAFQSVGVRTSIRFAIKATPVKAVLTLLAECNCGMDAVSEGEIRLALAAGVKPDRIIFSGVGKKRSELAYAVQTGIGSINLESMDELEELISVTNELSLPARVGIRLNPQTETDNHSKIATGHAQSKFGIPSEQAMQCMERIKSSAHLKLVTLSVHIGSQINSMEPFEKSFTFLASMVREALGAGNNIENIDIGGGLAAPYRNDEELPPLPSVWAEVAARHFSEFDKTIIIEPGRVVAANAGILVGKVIYNKVTPARRFIITDVGMNDLVRPTLYEAWHEIIPIIQNTPCIEQRIEQHSANSANSANSHNVDPQRKYFDVVGPICESGDYIALGRAMRPMQNGELFAIMGSGAYATAMASEYNFRPRVADVLVDQDRYAVIRKRRTYQDMLDEHASVPW